MTQETKFRTQEQKFEGGRVEFIPEYLGSIIVIEKDEEGNIFNSKDVEGYVSYNVKCESYKEAVNYININKILHKNRKIIEVIVHEVE